MIAGVRVYVEFMRRGYRRYTAYRAAVVAGLFTTSVFGMLRAAVMIGVFAGHREVGGFTLAEAITYVWLVQGLMSVVQMYGSDAVASRVRDGDVSIDLLRPVDVQLSYLASDLGRAGYHALYRGIPPLLIGMVFFDLTMPRQVGGWLAFVVSVALAATISYLFRFLYNLSAFWLMDYRGVSLVAVILVNLLSGFVIPVSFFPDWLRGLAELTPFPSMIQIPVDIFTGRAVGIDVLPLLATQLGWTVALFGLGRVVFEIGRRHLVFQGG